MQLLRRKNYYFGLPRDTTCNYNHTEFIFLKKIKVSGICFLTQKGYEDLTESAYQTLGD